MEAPEMAGVFAVLRKLAGRALDTLRNTRYNTLILTETPDGARR